jgi:hypothetical protein
MASLRHKSSSIIQPPPNAPQEVKGIGIVESPRLSLSPTGEDYLVISSDNINNNQRTVPRYIQGVYSSAITAKYRLLPSCRHCCLELVVLLLQNLRGSRGRKNYPADMPRRQQRLSSLQPPSAFRLTLDDIQFIRERASLAYCLQMS